MGDHVGKTFFFLMYGPEEESALCDVRGLSRYYSTLQVLLKTTMIEHFKLVSIRSSNT